MSQLHGKAGKYEKEEIKKINWFGFIAIMGFLSAFGFGLGLAIAWRNSVLGLTVSGVMLAGIYFSASRIEKSFEALDKRRIKYLRGGQAEALVGWLLKDLLSNDWHVFNGIQLEENSDVDHIVVGPGGVYCISTKSDRGLFSLGPDGNVLHNNKPTRYVEQALGQTMGLKRRLDALVGADAPFVHAVLAVPLAYVEFSGPRKNVWVLHQDDLAKTLAGAPKRLSGPEIARFVETIGLLAKTSRNIFRRDNVESRKIIEPTPAGPAPVVESAGRN